MRDMWNWIVLSYNIITVVYTQQQNSRRPEKHDNGHGWDIRLAVPGEPGGDYPTLNAIPRTSFSCSRKSPGYYADGETGCQVFRVCTLGSTYGFQSFLCPNGTLFNQEVFVCDWWMNVKCDRSNQLFNENRGKFQNLKLGPQLMKDIKKMLTHPMRNPYDKSVMKSNLIVMQDYKPPMGQLFPNEALISGPERPPSNIYIPSKQRQGNLAKNSFITGDLSFAASTPSSQLSAVLKTVESPKNIDILQRQSIQNFNSHTGLIQPKNSDFNNNNRLPESSYFQNQNLLMTPQKAQNGQFQRQTLQYNRNIDPSVEIKQPDKSGNIISTQYSYIPKQSEQLVERSNLNQFPKEVRNNLGTEAQQHIIRQNIGQPTGKTLKFSRIVQKSSSGNPKSRITFKTWIVRPTKSARLVAEPTPYTYDKQSNPPRENRLIETTAYNNNPTTEKFNPDSEDLPYIYNRPTPSSKQIITVDDTPRLYLPPTMPTLSNRLYSTSKITLTSKQSQLDLPPTTYKPTSRLYVPPSESSLDLSRQYLIPNSQSQRLPETNNYPSARLVVTPTADVIDLTTTVSNNKQAPSFSLVKQSHINTNRNNLTFSDILTKEKLDITVNDIVRNTNEILKTASPDELRQYRQNYEVADNLRDNYLSKEFENEFDEKATIQPQHISNKSAKLIATPSTELEPPIFTSDNHQNSNRLVNLPFFKEPALPTNTIERTVSLKITIPEIIADYLFKNHTQSDSNSLEILNTGSSNYLVLSNSNLDENNNLIPIGKLVLDKNINISDSQSLVYSILADSINAAKEYSNIAKQNVLPNTSTLQQSNNMKTLNNEDISDITDKISQLTLSQFAKDNVNKGNVLHSSTSYGQYIDNSKHITEQLQPQSVHNHQSNPQFPEQNPPNLYSSRLQRLTNNNVIEKSQGNTEQIFSGQLYKLSVPEVTSKIYNSPTLPQTIRFNEFSRSLQPDISNLANNVNKHSNTDVEIIPSESLPYPPARQQLPSAEKSNRQFLNIQDNYENIFADNFLNTDTAITAQVQDKITGTLPHPLEDNKLVTYQKNKSYYLYTKLDEENNDIESSNTITSNNNGIQNAKLVRDNDISNRVTFELFPAIGYELEDEQEKQRIFNTFKINNHNDSGKSARSESYNQKQNNLVTGVDFTIIHPSSKKQTEQHNNVNTILYRGPSSYLAPQSSVGSLRETQRSQNNARIEQFDENNGYSKIIPAKRFSF